MSLTLKPCPFCGGEAEQRPVRDGTKTRCKRCSADVVAYNGPNDPGGRIRSAEQWNTRQDSSAERAEGRPSPEGEEAWRATAGELILAQTPEQASILYGPLSPAYLVQLLAERDALLLAALSTPSPERAEGRP